MKNLFLIAILFLSLTAFGQGTSVVRVVQLGADYAATPPTVEFRVYWDAAPDNINHLDSVWVFVDYQPISSTGTAGAWTPATLSTPATASAGTVIPVAGNTRGFYLRGTPAAGFSSTVTVELAGLVAGDKFNWCAYVSDYPPNATPGAGFYNLHGTPPFIINGSVTEPTRQFSGCIDALTDATGCPGLIPAKPEITAFTPLFDTICAGETVTLSATATGASEYSFDDGATWQAGNSASVAPTTDATYILKVRNAAGCTVTAAAVASIKVYPKPVATFTTAPAAACGGSSVTVVADGGGSYCFTHSCTACGRNPYRNGNDDPTDFDCRIGNDTCIYSTSNSYTFTMPDSGSVTVCVRMLTANGCADSICTTISAGTVTPPTPILAGAGTYCDNTVLNSYGVAGYSYQLQNILLQNEGLAQMGADAPLTFPITASGIYTLTVADAVTNCTTTSNAVEVTVNALPTISVWTANPCVLIEGNSATLTATASGAASYRINGGSWQTSHTFVVSPTVNSTYTLTVQTAAGCSASASTTIQVVDPGNVEPMPSNLLTYIGAFWKNTQTGERLIRIPYVSGIQGSWTAVASAPWIVLDTSPTADAGVTWASGESPKDMNTYDATYQVSGSASSVSGTLAAATGNYIYFRIGLTGTNPGTAPRYGLVVLYYNNNTKYHLIYIRQGEAAAAIANTTGASYTVYNLKDPANGAGGSTVTDHTDLSAYGGKAVFTAYPSQAGSLFQFGGSPLRAYHPVNAGHGVQISGWYNYTGAAANECPAGYRRPTYTPNNEMTPSGSHALGYYADGFFDRHEITVGITTDATNLGVVKKDKTDVAYFGTLFFNPTTLASIFYPMSGERRWNTYNGQISRTGNYGRWWSGSDGYILHTSYESGVHDVSIGTIYTGNYKSYGFSVRCVKD